MIRLDQITLREIRLALREPFKISSGEVSERRIILLELRDADGTVSWSECVAGEWPNYSSETVDTAWLAIEAYVAPRVLGVSFDAPGDVHAVLERDFRGHQMAKAAVEMGIWGVAATQAGLPLGPLHRVACERALPSAFPSASSRRPRRLPPGPAPPSPKATGR